MNGLGSILGRGLLVLALSGFALACGDDDGGGGGEEDAGPDGGPTAGHAGGGGAGHAGGGAGNEADAGPEVSFDECVDMTETNTGGMVPADCSSCLCEMAIEETVACDSMCWALISCFQANCADVDPSNMSATTTCAINNCMDSISGAGAATPLGMIIRQSCADECVPAPGGDAGVDAGN